MGEGQSRGNAMVNRIAISLDFTTPVPEDPAGFVHESIGIRKDISKNFIHLQDAINLCDEETHVALNAHIDELILDIPILKEVKDNWELDIHPLNCLEQWISSLRGLIVRYPDKANLPNVLGTLTKHLSDSRNRREGESNPEVVDQAYYDNARIARYYLIKSGVIALQPSFDIRDDTELLTILTSKSKVTAHFTF